MKKYVVTAIMAGLVILGGCSDVGDTGNYTCEINTLDSYGFEQQGDVKELVCANPNDKTDFVVITDEKGDYEVGETYDITIDK